MKVWKGPWIITDLIPQSFGPKPPWKWPCHLALPVDSSFPERLGKIHLIKRGYLLWFTIVDNHEGGLIVSWKAACDAMVCCPKKKKKGQERKWKMSPTAACWMSPINGLNESHGKTKLKLASSSQQSWLCSSWVTTRSSKKHHTEKMRKGSHARLSFGTHLSPLPQIRIKVSTDVKYILDLCALNQVFFLTKQTEHTVNTFHLTCSMLSFCQILSDDI